MSGAESLHASIKRLYFWFSLLMSLSATWFDVIEGYFLLFRSLLKLKLVSWWKFNCCFESRRQPKALKLLQKAPPSKEMLCQSCFHHQRTFLGEKCYKRDKNRLENNAFSCILINSGLSESSNEKLSGAYLTLQKMESHFPWNTPRDETPREMKQHIKHQQIAAGKMEQIQHTSSTNGKG